MAILEELSHKMRFEIDESWGTPTDSDNIPDDAYLAVVRDYNGEYGIDKVVVPAEYWNGKPATIGFACSTGYSGGAPLEFTPPTPTAPKPQFDHCEYCGTKTFPEDRCCVACGAPA